MSRYEVSCNGFCSRVAVFEREMTLSESEVLVFDGDLYAVKVYVFFHGSQPLRVCYKTH